MTLLGNFLSFRASGLSLCFMGLLFMGDLWLKGSGITFSLFSLLQTKDLIGSVFLLERRLALPLGLFVMEARGVPLSDDTEELGEGDDSMSKASFFLIS